MSASQNTRPKDRGPGGPDQQRTGHGRSDQPPMTVIHAPYNFVPLANWVHIPPWSAAVSQDWPFEDGYSGELHVTLTSHTPLLVGGSQSKGSKEQAGRVEPFRLPDGRFAIPGSSLKGMLRAVIEIAGFGRMRMVDRQRPALRDISKGDTIYTRRVRDKIQAGWLEASEDGGRTIVPCRFVWLEHRELEKTLGRKDALFSRGQSVRDKYETWARECASRNRNVGELRFSPLPDKNGKMLARQLDIGNEVGHPVFTGQVSDSTTKAGKKRDFLFYGDDPSRRISVPDDVWQDFLRVHGNDEKRGADAMSWPGYWKARFHANKRVPVFYVNDGGTLRIGLAYMLKLAGDFSTLDMIAHSSPLHRDAPGAAAGYDLADLLFGAINESGSSDAQADALRGRVSCGMLVCDHDVRVIEQHPTILNGPKPSYFPNYVRQSASEPTKWKVGSPASYAAYIRTNTSSRPTLRGFKRYPVRPPASVAVQELSDDQKKNQNRAVQISLQTLPPQTRFSGRIVFHNLKREELGALLWAVTWGGRAELRHALGMGKPFGFGQANITIDHARSRIVPNDPSRPSSALSNDEVDALLRAFTTHMDETARGEGKLPGWEQSPQMLDLLAMADPRAPARLKNGLELRHMRLDDDEFTRAKQAGLVLADYADATGYKAAIAEEQRARREREQAAAEQAREAELKDLTGNMRTVKAFERSCAERHAAIKGKPDSPNTEFHNKARELVKTALDDAPWLPEERTALAETIEHWLPKIVRVDMKDERKKLRLAQLRGNT